MTASGSISGANAAQIKASSQQVAVRLINIPESLQNTRQTLRIEGQIISRGVDKTLLLKTGYGDVTVQAKGAIRAQEGQRVQVDIPPRGSSQVSVLRTSNVSDSSIDIVAPSSQKPSLTQTVADQGVVLSRKGDLSGTTISATQSSLSSSNLSDKGLSLKAGDLAIGTNVRLSPFSGQVPSNVGQTISTQLAQLHSQFLSGGFANTQMNASSGTQTANGIIGHLTGMTNAGTQSGFHSMNQMTSGVYTLQGLGQAGSLNGAQSFTFPPAGRFDVQFIGGAQANVGHMFSSLSSQASALLLNGQATAMSFQAVGFTNNQQPVVSPLYSMHASGYTNPNPPQYVLQFPAQNLQVGNVVNAIPVGTVSLMPGGVVPLDQFSSLTIAMRELQVTNPAMAQALSSLTPQASSTPAQTGTAALFLLSALKGGGLDTWAGPTSSIDSKSKLFQILEQTLKEGATAKLVQNTPSGDWRAYSFPMQAQNNVAVPVSLFVQDYYQPPSQDDKEHEREIKMTRFVFEFDLTRMGEVQVDGMMREKNVDIFIRTRRDLTPEMKKAVRGVYLNALERSNLTGDVAFQSDPEKWLDVAPKEKATL